MESGGPTHASADRDANALTDTTPRRAPKLKRRLALSVRHVQTYRLCDLLTEGLIYLMVLFGPWAFGTTQTWAIWTMNVAGYTLGLLLIVKYLIRLLTPYRPPRWNDGQSATRPSVPSSIFHAPSSLPIVVLALLTFLLLAYTLTSALNARATYSPDTRIFDYHDCISWLPHSFDSRSTWFAFYTYLALAAFFWSLRDWLLGKTGAEEGRGYRDGGRGERMEDGGWKMEDGRRKEEDSDPTPASQSAICNLQSAVPSPSSILHPPSSHSFPLPARLRRLLWLLALNGLLLGLEGILQRLENCPKLLFLVQPRINSMAEAQFGPYAYRSNAAQYFNLLWPVCLGFWWTLNRSAGRRRTLHHLLLLCAAIMAACPIISTTRAGAIVSAGLTLLGGILLLIMNWLFGSRRRHKTARWATLAGFGLFLALFLILGYSLGWKALQPRLGELHQSYEGRERIYEAARHIADDYPLFGTGPGTYESISELYRPPGDQFKDARSWPAQAHNDFLETRITFGWVGSVLAYLALACVLGRWFIRGGIHGGRRFVILIWLALAGCFVQARFDFPFQIHSILFLFLLLCAILSVISRRAERA